MQTISGWRKEDFSAMFFPFPWVSNDEHSSCAVLSNWAESNLSILLHSKTSVISTNEKNRYNFLEYNISNNCFKTVVFSQNFYQRKKKKETYIKKKIKDRNYTVCQLHRPYDRNFSITMMRRVYWNNMRPAKGGYHVSHMVKRENATWRRCGPFVNDWTESATMLTRLPSPLLFPFRLWPASVSPPRMLFAWRIHSRRDE